MDLPVDMKHGLDDVKDMAQTLFAMPEDDLVKFFFNEIPRMDSTIKDLLFVAVTLMGRSCTADCKYVCRPGGEN